MEISTKTRQMLWGRAAGRCAFPECRAVLVVDATESDDATLIGEVCHMVAESSDGPRGISSLTTEERSEYSNLILLCRNHHRIVDTQVATYTVEILEEMKSRHEAWVRDSLPGYDRAKQRDDEIYAGYVDEWSTKVDLDNWRNWSSWVLAHDQPQLSTEQDKRLFELRQWLLSRIWPSRYKSLEHGFENFRRVLGDFQETFRTRADRVGPNGEMLLTRKFYHIDSWDPELYERLAHQYDVHVGLVQNLMLELTRAGNYVCDEVRRTLQPGYRMSEGRLVIEYGPTMKLEIVRRVPQYTEANILAGLYPGLEAFKTAYLDRDFSFPMSDEIEAG